MDFFRQHSYLDSAAAHPVRPRALRAFLRANNAYGNPSAPHGEGRKALALLEAARAEIARELGAKADAIIFTSGATESNALAIEGHIRARIEGGTAAEKLHVLYSPTQHSSVLGAVRRLERLGVATEEIPLSNFALDLPGLARLLRPETALITLDAVCGETGTLFDTRAVRHLIDAQPLSARPVFHMDATQAPLVERMERTRIGADLISFDAQKIGGVRGIGALVAPRNVSLAPIISGGGQERGLRSGTPSPALAAAFASALAACAEERESFVMRAAFLKKKLTEEMLLIPYAVLNAGAAAAPHIVNVSFLGRDTDYLAALLDERGISVSTRSACETDAEGSRVVLSYTQDEARASSTLRISLNAKTTEGEVRRFITALIQSVAFIDASP